MATKYLNDSGLAYFWLKIKAIVPTKQSDLTNDDYTVKDSEYNTYKTKIDNLETTVDGIVSTGGEENVLEGVQVNGADLAIDGNKKVNVTIAEGSTAGTIAVNGVDVKPKDLATLATSPNTTNINYVYTDSSTGASVTLTGTQILDTLRAASADYESRISTLEEAVGSGGSVDSKITTAIQNLDSSAAASTNTALSGITITDGKITAKTEITVPTNNNQLTNGAGYQTASDVASAISGKADSSTTLAGYGITNAYTKTEVDDAITSAIGDVTQISYSIVTELPETGEAGVIYLISNGGSNPNIYDEYIYANSAFEKIGTTDVDLSGYLKTTDVVSITNAEIDTIVAS